MKKSLIPVAVIAAFTIMALIVLFVILFTNKHNLSNKLTDFIDSNSDNSICTIEMNEITDFKWDKMLIYQVGTSEADISSALKIKYADSTDLTSGIIFIHNNKIVYEEKILYDPEHPYKLHLYATNNEFHMPSFSVFTPLNAIFKGEKTDIDGVIRYVISPLN